MKDDTDAELTAQVKVTIEVSGSGPHVARILDALTGPLTGRDLGGGEREPEARETLLPSPAWWTPERALAFARRLRPPALQALLSIAASAPSVAISAVQLDMRRAGFVMTPGALSSIGFAVRALGSPAPFVRDNRQGVYRMDPSVAATLLPAVRAEHGRRRTLGGSTQDAADE